MQIPKRARRQNGFTLVELMVTVGLIGVLAAIAIPNFLTYQARSRRSEAMTNLAAVGRSQKAYQADRNDFHNSTTSWPDSSMYGGLGTTKMPWDSDATTNFEDLGWEPEGQVYYTYGTYTPVNAACTCALCFTAAAYGDVDGDGFPTVIMYVHPQDLGGSFGECKEGILGLSGKPGVYDAPVALSNSQY